MSTIKKTSEKNQIDITKILGSKTGTTGDAGLCISVLINHQNHELIIITLGASQEEKIPYNILDAIELTKFIENNYSEQTLSTQDTTVKTLKIVNSKITNYEIKSKRNISKFLENDYNIDNFKIQYNGLEELSYKNEKGEKIGTIKYLYNNLEIDSEDIYLDINIKPDILKIIYSKKEIIIVIISFFIILITSIMILIKKQRNKNVQSI